MHFNTRLDVGIIHQCISIITTLACGAFHSLSLCLSLSLSLSLSFTYSFSLSLFLSHSATLLLVPLLGLQYMLTPFRPDAGHPWETTYQVISAFTASFQVSNSLTPLSLYLFPLPFSPLLCIDFSLAWLQYCFTTWAQVEHFMLLVMQISVPSNPADHSAGCSAHPPTPLFTLPALPCPFLIGSLPAK